MSSMTNAKKGRKFEGIRISRGKVSYIPRESVTRADPRETYTFVHNGVTLSVLMSPGQVINKEKTYRRHMKTIYGYDR